MSEMEAEKKGENTGEPDPRSVLNYLIYGLSIPERALRSTTAVVGGTLRETTNYLVPRAFRDSKCYSTFITQTLDFLSHDVGGVTRQVASGPAVEGYVAKKAASQFVELAGLATLHTSPLIVLAVISDVAYGSRTFLNELAIELRRSGIIGEKSTINSTSDLLDAVGDFSSRTTSSVDLPPLDIEGLKQTIRETAEAAARADPRLLIPQKELNQLWSDMHSIAMKENASLLEISGAMSMYTINQIGNAVTGAVSTLKVTGHLLDRHVLDHYRRATNEIWQKGLYSFVASVSAPYKEAVWYNFESTRDTVTEDLLSGRMVSRAWAMTRDWFGKRNQPGTETRDGC